MADTTGSQDDTEDVYKSEFPEGIMIDDEVRSHIRQYYQFVDTIGKHEEYAQSFATDAILNLPNGSTVGGREALTSLHQNMWDNVERRIHRPAKVFPFGNKPHECMIIGTVEHWGKDTSHGRKDMAALMKLQRNSSSGTVEIRSLSVWLK